MKDIKGERIVSKNLALLYGEAAKRFGRMPAFATRKSALRWHPVSYSELYEQGLSLATGLIDLGVSARDHLGLFGDNRYEWMLADYGIQLCGAADVPRGRDVSDAELKYIVDHAGIKVSFVETKQLATRLLNLQSELPKLEKIIMLDTKADIPEGVLSLESVCTEGARLRATGDRRAEERIAGVQPDDLFTLIYTSGTTGTPKGVMLSHENMTHNDCLKILGRSKATIVLSSGENVEPEPLEMQLQRSRFIDQCMVVGQDKKFLGLLVVPNLTEFGKAGLNTLSMAELAELPEAREIIKKEIRSLISLSGGYKKHEQITDFSILPERFEIGQELTNLFKIKRHVVSEKYNDAIEKLLTKTNK